MLDVGSEALLRDDAEPGVATAGPDDFRGLPRGIIFLCKSDFGRIVEFSQAWLAFPQWDEVLLPMLRYDC